MTSMIDIIFQLLIFFVCASAGQIHESHLPTELTAGSIENPNAAVIERPLGEVWLKLHRRAGELNGNEVTIAELNDREYSDERALRQTLVALAETANDIPVILDIDGPVPIGDVVRAYDACQAARFRNVSFAVRE